MFEIIPAPLRAIGLTPPLALRAQAHRATVPAGSHPVPRRLARLCEVHRDSLGVHDGAGEFTALLHPTLRRQLRETGSAPAVGDWAWVEAATAPADDPPRVVDLVPPANLLMRRDADGRRHVLVANVDLVLIAMGLDDDYSPRRLERYLALVHSHGLPAVVVLTKADLVGARAADEALGALRRRLPEMPGVLLDLVAVDATAPAAGAALAPWATPGRTLVLLGSSGAGKSTLTNALLGRTARDTGAVRRSDGRGQHTTTVRTLLPLPGGACVIDTPGLRALAPDIDEAHVGACFVDVQRLAPQCRFRNCRHGSEPGCAVRDGVDADRLLNYGKLLREARRETLTPLERRRQLAEWKARGREGVARARQKRGEA